MVHPGDSNKDRHQKERAQQDRLEEGQRDKQQRHSTNPKTSSYGEKEKRGGAGKGNWGRQDEQE